MTNKNNLRVSLSLFLLISIFTATLAPAVTAQTAVKQTVSSDLQSAVAKIEEKTEARRKELGIPGMSLVIVKDDRIIFMKGFGYKDYAKQIPVTADTEFAIGSASKAFTALSVLMSQDEGKLSLDDNPKKHLAYFKINDPEIDKNITIRDILSHASGLNRTDLAWVSGKLNREEIIRVAGEAKPVAKLREKFQYQNVMFLAAGEIVAKVQKQPFETVIETKIFQPLGMTNSNLSVTAMQRAKDYSLGYDYNFDTKETKLLPFRNIDEIAPAGAINSSAKDMAQWLRFILNRGEVNGKRLVSEKGFDEWLKPQMKIGGKTAYGLGWFLQDWNNLKVVQHGGNIDGFNSMVAMIPEKKLGFVMLTNVSGSSLGGELMPIVWENILGNPNAATNQTASADASKEIGSYRFEAAGFDIEVKMQDGKLVAVVPGQPTYILERVGERKYKLTGAPDGFFVTFKDTEAFLEQPQGNYTLPKVAADGKVPTVISDAAKELVGKYASEKNAARIIEITQAEGKVTLNVEGQQPYALNEKSKDLFSMSPLPDDYKVRAKRDGSGKLTGITIMQPEGEFGFNRIDENAAKSDVPKMTVDELMSKVTTALGGEAAWRKLNSRVATVDFDFVHQGVKGSGTIYGKAPNKSAQEATITAFGKTIGTLFEYFDGTRGGEEVSFAPADEYTGKQLEDARISANFYGLIGWKTLYKTTAELKGTAKVGDEDAYVVVFEPEKANKDTIYFSQKTFLPLKLESVSSSSTSSNSTPYSETYSDYRPVDGVMIPFKTVNSNVGNGDLILTIKEVKHNVAIDDKTFQSREKKMAAKK